MARTGGQQAEEFSRRIEGAVFAMHVRLPFFAMLLEACSLHLDETGRVPTACVDEQGRITFGASFAAAQTDLQLAFVLAHEVSHVAFGHFARVGTRDRFLWNVATDYAINQILVECFGTQAALPDGALFDARLANLSGEQIYERLARAEARAEARGTREAGSRRRWRRRRGGPPGSPEMDEDMDYEAERCGGRIVRLPRLPIRAAEREAWRERVAAAAARSRIWGTLPSSLVRFLEEHLQSKVDWAAQLRQFLRFGVARDGREQYTFVPCSRRHIHAGLYLPSLVGAESPRIAFAIDTSGSMSVGEIGQAHAEIDEIRRQFGCGVYLIDCDSAVHSGRWVGPFEALPLPRGGGGTDFRPVFRHLIDERIAADLLVYLTDGMGEFGDDPGIPTIWVMTTDARPPWGEFVQMGVDA